MLSLEIFFYLFLILMIVLQAIFTHIPLGNENSNVRRLPMVTFAIIILNVVIYIATLPVVAKQEEELVARRYTILEFMERNPSLLFDKTVRQKLTDEGVVPEDQWQAFDASMDRAPGLENMYKDLAGNTDVRLLHAQLDQMIVEFKAAIASHFYYQYGLAPNGKWKFYQLITCLFLHGGILHLVGNMLFFFAVGFSLEDLWGRGTFLAFYLLGGIAACLPSLISTSPVPMIGASGAISATMGAFLIRLPKAKIKIGWMLMPFSVIGILLIIRKRLFGVIHIPTYIYMPYYLTAQIVSWWYIKKTGEVSGVAYSAHIAGFAFGIGFALLLKLSKVEEKVINPRIESKVAFSTSPVIAEAFELMDQGDYLRAEQKLQTHLQVLPNDDNAMLALIQVYQNTGKLEQVNTLYSRLIRLHLAKGDKEAALYAYDSLLSAFPEDQVNARLPVRDWMMICSYIKELGMLRESAIEFERLAKTWDSDALSVRACMEGADAALSCGDEALAKRMYEQVLTKNPTEVYANRAHRGLEKCLATGGRQRWAERTAQQNGVIDSPPPPKALP